MKKNKVLGTWLLIFLVWLMTISTLYAHVPVNPDGKTLLNNAVKIDNPTKSWAIYGKFEVTERFHYYYADFEAGDRLDLTLSKAVREENDEFFPTVLVFGEEFGDTSSLPPEIEVPSGYGWIQLNNTPNPEAEYEPFGPSYYADLSEFEYVIPNKGRYYFTVASTDPGYYLLVVGVSESFTLYEWISNPIQMLAVYRWQGQSWLTILVPWIVTLLGLSYLFFVRNYLNFRQRDWQSKVYLFISITFLGSSVQFVYQMILSTYFAGFSGRIILSAFIASLPLVSGLYLINLLRKHPQLEANQQKSIVILSLVNLFIWSGMVIFPVTLLAVSLYSLISNTISLRDNSG